MMRIDTALRWMCLGLMTVGLSACVQSKATITSNKAPDYHPEIKRLLVLTELGIVPNNSPVGDVEGTLEGAVTDSLAKCGIVVKFQRHDPLALQSEGPQAIRSFSPDTVMTLGVKATGMGRATPSIYLGSIIDMTTKKLVWKSEIDFQFAWSSGETLAATIVGRLKADTILGPSCPTPVLPLRGI
jgi:hypothetical protein